MPIRCHLSGRHDRGVVHQPHTHVVELCGAGPLAASHPPCSRVQTALDIRQSVFGGKNIHVATAHEDLAYSSYVHQYSSGKFDNAL